MVQADRNPARLPEAVRRLKEVAAVRERLYGSAHPDTLGVWLTLSFAYSTAARVTESKALDERIVAGWQQVVADRERELGPDAPDTQFARLHLADCSEWDVARALRQQVAESWGRLAAERSARLGPVHPDTIAARERYAYGHRSFDRYDDEVRQLEEIAADLMDALGPTDPRTLHAQVQLAARYLEGNHNQAAAIDLGERIIDEVRRVLGPEHEDLRLVRAVLITSLVVGGRTEEAFAVAAHYPMPDDEDDLK
ncbi:tetratricopeptide repeat protein [Actinoplanes sp. NPDC051346]|uniref:tetratricopeptide repeat protein n=1 Tax=Actinoplanes sp. NPDC051346 TaxID=3155048 RepID=UPI003415FD7D